MKKLSVKLIIRCINTVAYLLFGILNLSGQSYIFEHYGVEDGLPSSEVYAQIQDRDGYVWFVTDKGVCRYDGYKFKTYTVKDGLASNSNVNLFEDYKGRIWFAAYEGYLSYYKNGVIRKHPLNDTIAHLSQNVFIDNIYIDTLDNLYFMPAHGGIYKINTENKISKIEHDIENPGKYVISLKEYSDGFLWDRINLQPDTFSNNEPEVLYSDSTYYLRFRISQSRSSIKRFYAKIHKGDYLISFINQLFRIKESKIINRLEYENHISGIYCDNDKNIWISVMYEGIYFYENGNLDAKPKLFLEGKTPATVFQDRENNYWLPTAEDGVYFISTLQFNVYNAILLNHGIYNVLSIDIRDNKLYFSTYDKNLYECSLFANKIYSIKKFPLLERRTQAINDILCHSDGSLWFLGNLLMKYSEYGAKVPLDTSFHAYQIVEAKDKSVLSAAGGGFIKYLEDTTLVITNESNFFSTHSICEDENERVWLGTLDGLYSYQNDSFEFHGNRHRLYNARISDIQSYKNYLWVGTRGEGLLVEDTNYVHTITEKEGLSSNFINTIYIDNDSTVWIGTNNGLNKLNITNISNFDYTIERYSRADGLPSKEIKSIIRNNNHIWLGTPQGLVSFRPDMLGKTKTPLIIRMDSITINNSDTTLMSNYELTYNQNYITIYFKAISFKDPNQIKYKYKLYGFDDEWIVTKNRYAHFANLPPGEYKFYLNAANEDGNWNANPLTLSFNINKHYSQTLIFILSIYILGAIFIFSVLYVVFRNQKNKVDLKRQLLLSEQKALRSQMNPHFIFNSMNSIQLYILENDSESADLYLTNFASLMRMVLENSRQNSIPLDQELKTVKLYLELEKLRFENNFNFSVVIDPTINPAHIKIPPMLIQPYIENAIWHGIMPKKSYGELKLDLKIIKNSILLCTIEDNGIGRKKAGHIAERRINHKSTSTKNIEERISLINKLSRTEMKVDITDLTNSEDEATGTRVDLQIPYLVFE